MALPLTYFVVFNGSLASEKAADLEFELRDHVPEGWLKVIVAGVLAKLWHRAGQVGEDLGDLGSMPRRRLARTLGWPGDPNVLIEALLVSGWIDQVEGDPDAFRAHNWSKWQPAVAKRISDRERKQAQRQRQAEKGSRDDDVTSGDVTRPTPEVDGGSRDLTVKTDREIDREIDRDPDLRAHVVEPGAEVSPEEATVARIAALEWPCRRGKGDKADPAPWRAPPPLIRKWLAATPGKDVLLELLKAQSWIHEAPGNRKTAGGYPRFIGGWLRKQPKQWPHAVPQASPAGGNDGNSTDPWPVLLAAIKATPRNERVELEDPVQALALTLFGGSNRIRNAGQRDLANLRRDFYESMNKAKSRMRPGRREAPAVRVMVGRA
jgi:hypothetical protein